jgi:hypothetical protein
MIRLRSVLGGITVSIVPIRYFWDGARDSTRRIRSARISNMQAPQARPGIIVIALLNTYIHSSSIVSISFSAMPTLSYPNSELCIRHTQTPSNESHNLKSCQHLPLRMQLAPAPSSSACSILSFPTLSRPHRPIPRRSYHTSISRVRTLDKRRRNRQRSTSHRLIILVSI